MRLSGLLAAALVAALVTACGSGDSEPGDRKVEATPTVRLPDGIPTTIPAADGMVRTRTHLTVLAKGDADPVLCIHGVSESYPPTCADGLPLTGFAWPDGVEPVEGVRFGEFLLTGRFDGETLAVTEATKGDGEYAPDLFSPVEGYATVCAPPAGGWKVIDPATTTPKQVETLPFDAEKLDGYNAMWFDDSRNPAPDDASTPIDVANDPAYLTVNVLVSEDVAGARRAMRKLWGGALCVKRTRYDLDGMQQLTEDVGMLPGNMGGSTLRERVEVEVVHDDGSFQRWADRRYGRGVVRVFSFLEPVSPRPAPASG